MAEYSCGDASREFGRLSAAELWELAASKISIAPASDRAVDIPALPEWCNVYEGPSDDAIADMEKTILQRADFSRPSQDRN